MVYSMLNEDVCKMDECGNILEGIVEVERRSDGAIRFVVRLKKCTDVRVIGCIRKSFPELSEGRHSFKTDGKDVTFYLNSV